MAHETILVIEDDADIRELALVSFSREGWVVATAAEGEEGLALARERPPACVVLDIMLPGMDGLELLRRLKADGSTRSVPVIMTTAKGEETDVVAGLDLGADDYVVKPYSPKVLVARVRAALRRRAETGAATGPSQGAVDPVANLIVRGDLALDADRHVVRLAGSPIDLSATEFALLRLLMANPGRVHTRSGIIDAIKGPDYPVTDRSVDVQVLQLRKKLGEAGSRVETVRGVGYRFREVP